MKIPYLDLTIQYNAIEPQLNDLVQKVLKSGQYVLGPEVKECERVCRGLLLCHHAEMHCSKEMIQEIRAGFPL